MSDSLWPHGLKQARLPCPSLSPRVCSNVCPFCQWCYVTISYSAAPFSFGLQSFPASSSFLILQFFTSGSQSVDASASASVLPMNIEGWCPLGLTGLISLQSKELSRVFSSTTIWKHWQSAFFMVQLTSIVTTGKTIPLTRWIFVCKVCLVFNMLSRLVIAFLSRSK